MKKTRILYLMVAVLIGFTACEKEKIEVTHTLGLEDMLTSPDSTWVGDTKGKEIKNGTYLNQFGDSFFLFDNYYTVSEWGNYGAGFMLTNGTDTKKGDHTNHSAITGKGVDGKVYLQAHNSTSNPAKISFKDGKSRVVKGMYITNTTYAYKVIENGNKFSKKFAANDWFTIKVIGLGKNDERQDSTILYLADFRNGKSEILNEWKWVDTKKFGEVKSIIFELASTDVGQFGMNTPSNFCLDGLKAIK